MPVYKRYGSVWVDTIPRKRVSGAMTTMSSLLVRSGASWVEKLALQLSLSPPNYNITRPNGSHNFSVTATVTGASGSLTYSWAWVDGPATGMTLSNTTSATCVVVATGTNNGRYGRLRCTVTEPSTGRTAQAVCDIFIQFGTPL